MNLHCTAEKLKKNGENMTVIVCCRWKLDERPLFSDGSIIYGVLFVGCLILFLSTRFINWNERRNCFKYMSKSQMSPIQTPDIQVKFNSKGRFMSA